MTKTGIRLFFVMLFIALLTIYGHGGFDKWIDAHSYPEYGEWAYEPIKQYPQYPWYEQRAECGDLCSQEILRVFYGPAPESACKASYIGADMMNLVVTCKG